MAFIYKTDLLSYIDESTVNQLTDNTDSYVEDAILSAQDRIFEKISPRFDLAVEFAMVGAARNRSLLKHCVSLSIYYLFQRLYTDILPEGRVEAMSEAEKWLNDTYEGKIQVSLTKNNETKQTGWPLKWGSELKKGSANY